MASPFVPTWYTAFGDIGNPAWTFFLSDLDFFIEFERRDREHRSSSLLPRQLPTAADYRQHQKIPPSKGKGPSRLPLPSKSAPHATKRRSAGISGQKTADTSVAPVQDPFVQMRHQQYERGFSAWTCGPQCTNQNVIDFRHSSAGDR